MIYKELSIVHKTENIQQSLTEKIVSKQVAVFSQLPHKTFTVGNEISNYISSVFNHPGDLLIIVL